MSIQPIDLVFIVALLEPATSRGLPSICVAFAIATHSLEYLEVRRDGHHRLSLATYDGIVDGFDHRTGYACF